MIAHRMQIPELGCACSARCRPLCTRFREARLDREPEDRGLQLTASSVALLFAQAMAVLTIAAAPTALLLPLAWAAGWLPL